MPKDNNCGKTNRYTIFFDNFNDGFAPNTAFSKYAYFEPVPHDDDPYDVYADDGIVTSAECQNLEIQSVPFTYTNTGGIDHVKYLVYQKNSYIAPEEYDIVYEGVFSALQTGLTAGTGSTGLPAIYGATGASTYGVNNVYNDLRLATAGLSALDPVNLCNFNILLTNGKIYVVYELLPFLRTEWGGPGPNYTGFLYAIEIGGRNVVDPLNDYVKLAIRYNKKNNTVKYLVNDEVKYEINRIGFPIDDKYCIIKYNVPDVIPSPSNIIRPNKLRFGFGTFSLMDAYNPINPGGVDNVGLLDLTNGGALPSVNPVISNIDGTSPIATYINPYSPENALFGQGAIIRIKYLTVYIENRHGYLPGLRNCKKELILSRCCINQFNGANSSKSLFGYCCDGCIVNCNECENVECGQCNKVKCVPNADTCCGNKCIDCCKSCSKSSKSCTKSSTCSKKCKPKPICKCYEWFDSCVHPLVGCDCAKKC